MEQNLKISVIVPSYNQGEFIENVINSVLFQTYSNWELIIQDGDSKDNTKSVCEKYVQMDERIFFYSEKDKGFADAVNKAIAKSTGKLAVIQSSDDFFAYNRVFENVEKLYNENNDLILISGASVTVDEELNCLNVDERVDKYVNFEKIYSLNDHFSQGATFFLLERAKAIGGLDVEVDMVADTDFWIRMTSYEPLLINSIYQTSKIFGGVVVQKEQRSADLSKFYLGRATMACRHLNNNRILLNENFKKLQANKLIMIGLFHYIGLNKDITPFKNLYKEINGVEFSFFQLSFKGKLKFILNRFRKTNNSKEDIFKNAAKNSLINYNWWNN